MKVIGLLGQWGSGKTTVVREIERRFSNKSNSKTHFFTYDTWLHQNDPARRSFLETLIHYLIQAKLIDDETWTKKLAEINGYLERTDTTTTPLFTTAGRWMLLSIAFVPLGVSLLGYDTLENALKPHASGPAQWALGLGLAFALLPLIAALLLYTIWRPFGSVRQSRGRTIFSKSFWLTHRKPYHDESIISLFMNKTTEKVLHVTARRPDPTSIEFQGIFRELMGEASSSGNKFVFVIDNLDRLAEAEALQIWGTIRSFFLGASETALLRRPHHVPTIILPIDPDAVRRMFQVAHDSTMAGDLAQAFMDKTFDVTFDVPEPVMSDWRKYLGRQINTAFGTQVNSYWPIKFFEDRKRRHKEKITPRAIIKFVNSVMSYHLQSPDEQIDIPVISYFAANRDEVRDNVLRFVTDERVIVPPIRNWQIQVAALYYGVPISKAAQVLLSDPIMGAIAGRNQKALEDLARIPGFAIELERVIAEIPNTEPNNQVKFEFVTNASILLGALKGGVGDGAEEIWRALGKHYLASTFPTPMPNDLDVRIGSLRSHIPPDMQRRFVDATAANLASVISSAAAESEITAVAVKAADQLVGYAIDRKIELPLFRFAADAQKLLRLLVRTSARPRVWKRYRTKVAATEVIEGLSSFLQSPVDYLLVQPALEITGESEFGAVIGGASELAWGPLVSAAVEIMQNTPGAEARTAAAAGVIGVLRAKFDGASSGIQELINQGHLRSRLNEGYSAGNTDLTASILAILILNGGDFGPPEGVAWASLIQEKPSLPRDIRSKLEAYSGEVVAPTVWSDLKTAPTARPLLESLIRGMIRDGDIGPLYVADTLKTINDFLAPLDAPGRSRFLAQIRTYETFWESLETNALDANFHRIAKSLKHASKADRERGLQLVRRRLDAVNSDEWQVALTSGTQPFALAVELLPSIGANWGKKSNLYVALQAAIPSLLANRNRRLIKRWFDLAGGLSDRGQRGIQESLADGIAEGGYVADRLALMKVGGVQFLTNPGFRPDALIRTVVLPLLDSGPARSWLDDHSERLAPLIAKASQEARSLLLVELDRLGRSRNASRREWSSRMKKLLGPK